MATALPMPLSPIYFCMHMVAAGRTDLATRVFWTAIGRPSGMFTEVTAARLVRAEAAALAQKQTQSGIMLLVVQEELGLGARGYSARGEMANTFKIMSKRTFRRGI